MVNVQSKLMNMITKTDDEPPDEVEKTQQLRQTRGYIEGIEDNLRFVDKTFWRRRDQSAITRV